MEGCCGPYCALLSVAGALILSGVGLALRSEYQYIGMKATAEHGETSLTAAGVYLLLAAVSLIYMWCKRSKAVPSGVEPLPGEPPKTIEMSERIREPNPDFTKANAGSSLLAQ